MAKRVPKASKRRLVFLTPLILFVVIYFLFTVCYYGVSLISLKNEHTNLSNDLVNLQAEEKKLKNEIEKLKDPDYLARYAREHFLYSKDGEYIIRLEKDLDAPEKEKGIFTLIEDYVVYIIGGLSILIILFIILIFKRNKRKARN